MTIRPLLISLAIVLALPAGEARAERLLLSVSVSEPSVDRAAVYDFVRSAFELRGDQIAKADRGEAGLAPDQAVALARSAGATAAVMVFVNADDSVRMLVLDAVTGDTRTDLDTGTTATRGLDDVLEWLVARAHHRASKTAPPPAPVVAVVPPPVATPVVVAPGPGEPAPTTTPGGTPLILGGLKPEISTKDYAWQPILFTAASLGLLALNLDTDNKCWGYCSAGGVLALGGYSIIVPAVHLIHNRNDAAAVSFGLRAGLPVILTVMFGLPIYYADKDKDETPYPHTIPITMTIGVGIAVLADIAFTAEDTLMKDKKKAAAKRAKGVAPIVTPTQDGFVAAVAGTF